jgi:hypothetical protein
MAPQHPLDESLPGIFYISPWKQIYHIYTIYSTSRVWRVFIFFPRMSTLD